MNKIRKLNIIYLCLLITYVATAVTALIYGFKPNQRIAEKPFILGILIALSSIPHIFIYTLKKGTRKTKKAPFMVFGIVGIGIGILFVLKKSIDLRTACIIWGVFDITRSSFEIFDVAPEIFKEKKYIELSELVISFSEIAFAILLLVEEFEGINVHIIFLGISFIVYFIKNAICLHLELNNSDE